MIKLTTKEYKELVEGAVKLKIVSEFLEKKEDNNDKSKELKLILVCKDEEKRSGQLWFMDSPRVGPAEETRKTSGV